MIDGSIPDAETIGPELPPCTVVLPAYNEEAAVGPQIANLRQMLHEHGILFEIIVVDDGSTDRTATEALAAGARVLIHRQNRGYGASIKTGVLAAEHEAIIICDADGTYPVDQIPLLLAQLREADMVVGARRGKHVAVPLVRRPAKWVLGVLARYIAQQDIPDLNSGLRAFRRACVRQYFPILSNRFSFTTTVTLALLSDGYRVVYHTIDYHARIGKSKIVARNFMDFIILILRMSMMFQPLRVFVPLSGVCGTLGLLKISFDIAVVLSRNPALDVSFFQQPTISTSAVLLLTLAFQLLLIGMMADGLIRRIGLHNAPAAPSMGVTVIEQPGFIRSDAVAFPVVTTRADHDPADR